MEDKIEFIVTQDGVRSTTSILTELNIKLQNEVNRLKIHRNMLAYALIEYDLEFFLHNSMNELTSGKYLSAKVKNLLRGIYVSEDEVHDMIRLIKLRWDADHYEEK